MRGAWLVVTMEILSIVSIAAAVIALVAMLANYQDEKAAVAVGGAAGFVALRAAALGLRLLDDIRRAIVARPTMEAEERREAWEDSP